MCRHERDVPVERERESREGHTRVARVEYSCTCRPIHAFIQRRRTSTAAHIRSRAVIRVEKKYVRRRERGVAREVREGMTRTGCLQGYERGRRGGWAHARACARGVWCAVCANVPYSPMATGCRPDVIAVWTSNCGFSFANSAIPLRRNSLGGGGVTEGAGACAEAGIE